MREPTTGTRRGRQTVQIAFFPAIPRRRLRGLHDERRRDSQTQLTFNVLVDSDQTPVFSPDETKLAFNSNQDGDMEIYTMNADGGGTPTQLTFNTSEDAAPAWSPDGDVLPEQP